jgi:hypothetical protein
MGERLTAERVAELRALCEAATPGPWRADPEPVDAPGWVSAGDRHEPVAEVYGGTHNAALIAAARNALPDLLDEVERLWDDQLDSQPYEDAMAEANATNVRLLCMVAERDAEIARLRQERQRLRGVIISAAARLARGELSLSDDPLDHGVKRMPARVEKAIRRQQDEHRDIAVNLAEHARAGDKHNP